VRASPSAIARGLTLSPHPRASGARPARIVLRDRACPARARSGPQRSHRATRPIFAALGARLPVTSASSRRCRGGRNSRRGIIRRGPSEKLRGRSPSSTHGQLQLLARCLNLCTSVILFALCWDEPFARMQREHSRDSSGSLLTISYTGSVLLSSSSISLEF